jgi:hypothetical protein
LVSLDENGSLEVKKDEKGIGNRNMPLVNGKRRREAHTVVLPRNQKMENAIYE